MASPTFPPNYPARLLRGLIGRSSSPPLPTSIREPLAATSFSQMRLDSKQDAWRCVSLLAKAHQDIPVAKVPSQLIFEWPALQQLKISDSHQPPGAKSCFGSQRCWSGIRGKLR